MGLWSDLPGELLEMIEENLDMFDDIIRFRCVCTHWQSSSPPGLPDLQQPQAPWMLLPYKGSSVCDLHLPFDKDKGYDIDLPEVGNMGFLGSGHGWVVTLQQNGSIHVLNPLSRIRFPLPPRSDLPEPMLYWEEINKIALSSSPTSKDFIAVASYCNDKLAYCKLGDKKWREFGPHGHVHCKDITFYRGKLYALTSDGCRLMICDDIVSSTPTMRECPPILSSDDSNLRTRCYRLVDSRDCDALMAVGNLNGPPNIMSSFRIFRLDTSNDAGWRWSPMENFDGDKEIALFMGCGPQLGIGNGIYFVNYNLFHKGVHFTYGVYAFEDKRCIKLREYEWSSEMNWPMPVWFTPNPY